VIGSLGNVRELHFDLARFFRAAFAPSLPRAMRVLFGKCATVLFRRAALAAFLMFRFAAARCFRVVIFSSEQVSRLKAYA
jgi:hypothetical protein